MFSFTNIAKVSTQAALAGINSDSSSTATSLSKQETQAKAIGKVAEMNIIKLRDDKKGLGLFNQNKKKTGLGLGLEKETYTALGQMGLMTANTRAGSKLDLMV